MRPYVYIILNITRWKKNSQEAMCDANEPRPRRRYMSMYYYLYFIQIYIYILYCYERGCVSRLKISGDDTHYKRAWRTTRVHANLTYTRLAHPLSLYSFSVFFSIFHSISLSHYLYISFSISLNRCVRPRL